VPAHSPARLFDDRRKHMTASSAEFPTTRYGALRALRRSMSRGELFAGLYVLGSRWRR
jgi:hypothetical protein